MPIMEISIIPVGTKKPSVSGYVAGVVRLLKKEKGIKYQLTSMGTIVEACSLKKLLKIAGNMHKAILGPSGVKRVVTTIKIDDRKDKRLTIKGKLESVYSKIER